MRLLCAFALVLWPSCLSAQVADETRLKVESAVSKVLEDTGAPSASVGIVQNGIIVYTHAFGSARLAHHL